MNTTTYTPQSLPETTLSLRPVAMAAALAALTVLANEVIDAWLGNHLMLSWLALSVVVFAGLWLVSGLLSRLSAQLKSQVTPWLAQRRAAQADARFLAIARHDPRVMADITAALARHQIEETIVGATQPTATLPAYDSREARCANIDDEIGYGRSNRKSFRV